MALPIITMTGYVGRDAELRYTQGGTAALNFSIAQNDPAKPDAPAQWYRVTIFGTRGEKLAQHITKGKLVSVTGRLSAAMNQGNDGKTYLNLDVVASEFDFVGKREDSASHSDAPAPAGDSNDIPF